MWFEMQKGIDLQYVLAMACTSRITRREIDNVGKLV